MMLQFVSYQPLTFADENICESSVYEHGVDFSKQSGESLIYNKNNKGHNIDPSGTPQTIIFGADIAPLKNDTSSLSER
jgi:hypothetical protein